MTKTSPDGEVVLVFLIKRQNKDIIKAYGTVKENLDSGQFLAIQKACITALNNYETIVNANKEMYLRRHKLIKEVLEKCGFKTSVPKAGFYQYVDS